MLKFNVIVILVLCTYASGQEKSVGKMKETAHTVLTFEVKFEPDPKLATPFQEDDNTTITSDGCDDHGNPYVQVYRVIPPNSDDVFKFGENGIVTFQTSKISDTVEPKWIADFASDSELYMLIEGNTRTEEHNTKNADGQDVVYWETKGEPQYYISRFDADGSYKGALKVDLPFRPKRLSGFASGNFLVAGIDAGSVLRLALLDSSGQLLRNIELAKNTKFAKEEEGAAEKTAMRSSDEESSEVAGWMRYSWISFLPYQNDVLFVRGRTGAPIYEINAGGQAHPVKIKSPEGYSVDYMIPSDRNWFVAFAESGKDFQAKSIVDELSPSSGELLARYLVEEAGHTKEFAEGQSEVACFHEGEFISVYRQAGKLTVLHGMPTPSK